MTAKGDDEAVNTAGGAPAGEAASAADHDAIAGAIEGSADVQKLLHLTTVVRGTGDILVAAKVALRTDKLVRDAARDIDDIAARVRKAVPAAQLVYIEPDLYRPHLDPAPATDVFFVKSAN